MADRYFGPQLIEYFDTSLIAQSFKDNPQNLPHMHNDLYKYFPEAGIVVKATKKYYFACNLNKGGTFRLVQKSNKKNYTDGGIVCALKSNVLLTNQWIDKNYKIDIRKDSLFIEGKMHKIKNRMFTPFKYILFRILCLFLGINPFLAKKAKGFIRKALILRAPLSGLRFIKNIELKNAKINIKDQIILEKKEKISKIFVGGNFNVRYVPQSRYFEPLDLHSKPVSLDKEKLKQLYLKKRGKISRCFHFQENDKSFTLKVEV